MRIQEPERQELNSEKINKTSGSKGVIGKTEAFRRRGNDDGLGDDSREKDRVREKERKIGRQRECCNVTEVAD